MRTETGCWSVKEFENLHAQEKTEYLRCLTDDCDLAGESRRTGNSIPRLLLKSSEVTVA